MPKGVVPKESEKDMSKYVEGSIAPWDVSSPMTNADTDTPAKGVERLDMGNRVVQKERDLSELTYSPKYLRYNVWDLSSEFMSTTAEWTETVLPLSRPPKTELDNPVIAETIHQNPELFKIVTPIKVDVFEKLLESHPN
jgi:hypothetical protein